MANKLKHQEEQGFRLLQNGVFFDVETLKKVVRLVQQSDFLREYTKPDSTFEALARTAKVLKGELQEIVRRPLYGSGSGEGGDAGGPEAGGGAPGGAKPSPGPSGSLTVGDVGDALEAASQVARGSGFGYAGSLLYLASAVCHVVATL
jgi:hypothetical protein